MRAVAARQIPPALKPGDCVAFVAPAKPVAPAALESAMALLQSWQLNCTTRWLPSAARGYLAGESDGARAAALQGALLDPQVQALWCARGGYGTTRLLPLLDWDLLRRAAPCKIVTGYSDITALHQALALELGWVCFHGPVAALPVPDAAALEFTRSQVRQAWTQRTPLGTLPVPLAAQGWQQPAQVVCSGSGHGPLVGGNLSLLAALSGTRWQLRSAGALLLLEDVDEAPYRIDRMLNQLLQAGSLAGCTGVVFGASPACEQAANPAASLSLMEVLQDLLAPLQVPVVYGWPAGHTAHQWTLPLGVAASLVAAAGAATLSFSAGAVA